MKHPIQPLETDANGTLRFKKNKIVEYLLDNGGIDMNDIAGKDFPAEDREQFAQLIGYSLSGYADLSYVSDEVYGAASRMAHGEDEKDARIAALENVISEARNGLKIAIPALFKIHPDDLG